MNLALVVRSVMVVGMTISAAVPVSAAEFASLMKWLPDDANVLLVLNVDQILASPLAEKEGWREAHAKSFTEAPLMVPPKAKEFILASQLDLEFMKPRWEVAVMNLSLDPTTKEIAKRLGGHVDDLGGVEAVLAPQDMYVVKVAPSTVGLYSPANRQLAARWVEKSQAQKKSPLSPYLQKAGSYADTAGTEIILALDLANVLSQQDVRVRLDHLDALKNYKGDLDKLAALLASIQGVTLGVQVNDKCNAKLKLDFGQDAAALAEIGQPLVLEALGNTGAMISDFLAWKPSIEENRLVLTGELSTGGLRRVLSIVELDATVAHQPKETAASESKPSGSSIGYTSLNYFKKCEVLMKDLKRDLRDVVSITQNAFWFDKYARRLEKLPILNVDPELVNYNYWVANKLRDAAGSVQGMGISSAARQAQIIPQYSVSGSYENYGPVARYGAYGGYRVYGGGSGSYQVDSVNVSGERRKIRAEEKGKMAMDVRGIFKNINDETPVIRRTMTERYKLEF